MSRFLYILLLTITANSLFSQGSNDKELARKMKVADDYYDFYDFRNALKAYQEIYPLDSLNPRLNYKIGISIYSLRRKQETAIPYFERAAAKNVFDAYYYLGQLYHLTLRFDEALAAYNKYKSCPGEKRFSDKEIERQIIITNTAEEMMKKPARISIVNMDDPINSSYPDYVPLTSADESVMIFTSRRPGSTGNLLDPNGEYFEDVYISYRMDDGWTEPKSISPNINTNGHDACVALSANGEKLFIYRTNEDLTAGDIYISKLEGREWSVPEKLGPDINTEEGWEPSASISADEEAFYFSSNRAGSLGEKDIYRVVKLPNGQWSLATNLGSVINTPYDEDSPFIHPDGKTLYFSSKGHKNMGGYDIYKTVKDENGVWSEPENLGYPINTVDNDIYFVMNVSGTVGYYSSARDGGKGETDIYALKMPENEFNLTAVKGTVLSEDKDEPVMAKITLVDEETKEVLEYKTNKLTGKYLLIITPGVNYQILVEADGYYPYNDQVNSGNKNIVTRLKKSENN